MIQSRFAVFLRRWADRLDPLPLFVVPADSAALGLIDDVQTQLAPFGVRVEYQVNYRRRLPDEVMNIVAASGVPLEVPPKKRPPNAPRVRKARSLKVAK